MLVGVNSGAAFSSHRIIIIDKINHFVFENANQILDDHYYVNTITGIPTIDIIEYDPATESNFNQHWHTHKDDMDNIDKSTLNAVGQTLLEVIYHEY